MDVSGTESILAPRERVWRFVTDMESVASCTPGVESVRVIEPDRRFEVVGGVKLGTVGLRSKTVIEWTERVELESVRMKIRGRAPGTTIDGGSELRLRDTESGTDLDWKGTILVRGALAALASRLLKPVTERVLREFFAAMKSRIESEAAAASGE